jgi:acetyl-CoA carboxylase biotin carboxyl carrier protein
MDDLEIVAILNAHLAKRGPRHDLEIALDRDPQRVEPKLLHHFGDADAAVHAAVLAVHPNPKRFVEAHRASPIGGELTFAKCVRGWTQSASSDRAQRQQGLRIAMAQAKDAPGSGKDGMRIDPALVRELAELLTTNGLTEIEVQDGERRIKVGRGAIAAAGAAPAAVAPALTAPPMHGKEDVGHQAELIAGTTIKSPMVGTAFMCAEPGAKPFIEVGAPVKAGDTLLIVEAMKVMNPITAPEGGVIKKIMVSDAQPVEFDQPLVIIG